MAERIAPSEHQAPDLATRQSDQLGEIVRSLYSELHRSRLELSDLTSEADLERDLGFDSLARAELLRRAEQALSVRLPEAILASVETFGDLQRALRDAAREAPTLPARRGPPVAGQQADAELSKSPRTISDVPKGATTLHQVLQWHADRHPESTHAIVLAADRTERITYAQLHDGARRAASALTQHGIEPGCTVALMLPTGKDYLFAFLGVLFAGAIPVPIYPPTRRSQLEEHVHRHAAILANAGVACLITVQAARSVARILKSLVPGLRSVLCMEELSVGGMSPTPLDAPPGSAVAMLQYTSGSTGEPKGVMLTHENLLANIRAMGKAVQASGSDVFVSWLPLYHDMGLIGAWLGSMYFGCLFVVMPPTSFLARPASWLRAIHEYRGTLSASPNFGYELCARRLSDEALQGLDLSSWRVAFNGAEPVFADTIAAFSQRFAPYGFLPQAMTPVYGLAEAAVGLTFPPLKRGPRTDRVDRGEMMGAGRAVPSDLPDALRFVSCGEPLAGYQVRIVDGSGAEVPERVEGEVEFTGPSATAGYYHNVSATARLLNGEWRDTGDRGYMAAGELYITGRTKDIIIRRGRHIYPEEIEQAVGDVEGVRRGCVAAFGTKEPGTATEKLIVLAETRHTDPTLLARLESGINQRVVDTVGEPPEEILLVPPHTVLKTSSGKLRRAATRSAYESGALRRAPSYATVQMLRLLVQSTGLRIRRLWRDAVGLAYGAYAWFVVAILALLVGLVALVLPTRQAAWRLCRVAANVVIRMLRIPFSVIRTRDADLPQKHIVVANHCSYVDSLFILAAMSVPHSFVAKAELERVPLLTRVLRKIGTLFIERFEPVQSVAEVDRLKQEVLRGNPLILFPEGTFTRITGLRPFHLGAFQVAAACGAPVVPCTLRGTRSLLRDGQRLLHRVPVTATIGAPLYPQVGGDSFAEALRLRDQARDEILRSCGEPNLRFLS